MELILKVSISLNDLNMAYMVVSFANKHNYLLQMDEQCAWLVTLRSQPE